MANTRLTGTSSVGIWRTDERTAIAIEPVHLLMSQVLDEAWAVPASYPSFDRERAAFTM
jgi:hypothetical protein